MRERAPESGTGAAGIPAALDSPIPSVQRLPHNRVIFLDGEQLVFTQLARLGQVGQAVGGHLIRLLRRRPPLPRRVDGAGHVPSQELAAGGRQHGENQSDQHRQSQSFPHVLLLQ